MKTTAKEKSQVDKFREAAREVETDDREEAFDAIVKKIAKTPVVQQPEKRAGTKHKK